MLLLRLLLLLLRLLLLPLLLILLLLLLLLLPLLLLAMTTAAAAAAVVAVRGNGSANPAAPTNLGVDHAGPRNGCSAVATADEDVLGPGPRLTPGSRGFSAARLSSHYGKEKKTKHARQNRSYDVYAAATRP